MNLGRYNKAWVAATAALAFLATALADGSITAQEAVNVVIAGLTAIGVYSVPNSPPASYDEAMEIVRKPRRTT